MSQVVGQIRRAFAAWNVLSRADMERLGDPIGGYEYFAHGKGELAVTVRPVDPEEHSPRPGQVMVIEEKPELLEDGRKWGTRRIHRLGWEVEKGSYQREQEKRRRRQPTEDPARPMDVLAAVPSLHRREPTRIVADRETDIHSGRLRTWIDAKSPAVIEVGGSPGVERSPAGYLAWLADRGVELSVAKGRLLATSAKPLGLEERTLIAEAEELLIGELSGKPVACSLCDVPAVSIAFPQAPVCEQHLRSEAKR
jgi:hypothetical protein